MKQMTKKKKKKIIEDLQGAGSAVIESFVGIGWQ